MYPIKHRLPALALLLLGFGCSSKASQSGKDGSANNGEAGRAVDSQALDSNALDTKTKDTGSVDGGISQDGRAAIDASDTSRDTGAKDSALDRGDAFDTSQAKDGIDSATSKDATDAATDAAMDAPIDGGPIPGLGTCASPIKIPQGSVHLDLTRDTTGAAHVLDFPCADNGSDLVFLIDVSSQQPQLVYADTFGTDWNTALFITDTCDTPKPSGDLAAVCSDDACGTGQSQVAAALGYGYYYLIVSGANGESGSVTVHIQTAALGTGPTTVLPQGSGSVEGTTSGGDRSALCDAAGPINNYWWLSCPDDVGGAFRASTCDGLKWDTVLGLQIPRTDSLSFNDDDDACGMRSTLASTLPPGAGLQVLTVGGSSGKDLGSYTLTYTRP
jgi:hypothetical protein